MADSLSTLDAAKASEPVFDWKSQIGSQGVWCALAAATALGLLFLERFVHLGGLWLSDANYSHAFLIGPISIAAAIRNLRVSKEPLQPELGFGLAVLAFGCFILIGTTIVEFWLADYLALCMILRGSAVIIGGRAWASAFTFPIFYLFFMFPLPIAWTDFTSIWLQDWVSVVSGKALGLFFVCHQQGNMIVLAGADQPLYVAPECSGLRQLVSFLALAVLMGHFCRRGLIFGLLMVIAAVPIAILSNVLRVFLMAVLVRYMGAASVSGWLHDLPALVTLPVGLLLFFVLAQILGDFFPSKAAPGENAV